MHRCQRGALPVFFIKLQMHRCQRGALPASFVTLHMHRCQREALLASFLTLQVNKTIFYNTTGNLNNERMFLFSITFFVLILGGPPCIFKNFKFVFKHCSNEKLWYIFFFVLDICLVQ